MRQVFLALAVLCLANQVSFANEGAASAPSYDAVEKTLPICRDKMKTPFRSNNAEVLKWKTSTRNQWQDRGYIIGKLVKVLQQRSSHTHLEVDISENGSSDAADHIEIIYNREFGDFQNPVAGQVVAACGDFINSFERAGNYPASPVGAIIHWVHASNTPNKHSHGFVSINGKLYGFSGDGAGQQPEMPGNDTAYRSGETPNGDDQGGRNNNDRNNNGGNQQRQHDKRRDDDKKRDREESRRLERRAHDYAAGDDLPWEEISRKR
jgi:hypothetical protein